MNGPSKPPRMTEPVTIPSPFPAKPSLVRRHGGKALLVAIGVLLGTALRTLLGVQP